MVQTTTATADLSTFCFSGVPSDPTLAAIWTSQCPAYLQGQFASAGATTQAGNLTTSLNQQLTQSQIASAQVAQQQGQAAILTALAGLSKAGPPPIPSGQSFDLSGLASAAQLKDADLTFKAAEEIGKKVKVRLNANTKALLVSATDFSALNTALPIEALSVETTLNSYTTSVKKTTCGEAQVAAFGLDDALAASLGASALASALSATVGAFQPSLLAATKTTPVGDPQPLLSAGIASGLEDKRALLFLRGPSPTPSNPVIKKLGELRIEISNAQIRLAPCKPATPSKTSTPPVKPPKPSTQDLLYEKGVATLAEANNYIANITKTDGTKPSLFDSAARRAAFVDANIKYILFLSRDEASGGVTAIKPNWYTSVQLYMGTSVGVSYQLVDLDGRSVLSGFQTGVWSEQKAIDEWAGRPTTSQPRQDSSALP